MAHREPHCLSTKNRATIERETALRYYREMFQSVSAQRMGTPNNTANAISLTQSSDSSARVSVANPRSFATTSISMVSYASYMTGRRTSTASELSMTSTCRESRTV